MQTSRRKWASFESLLLAQIFKNKFSRLSVVAGSLKSLCCSALGFSYVHLRHCPTAAMAATNALRTDRCSSENLFLNEAVSKKKQLYFGSLVSTHFTSTSEVRECRRVGFENNFFRIEFIDFKNFLNRYRF